MTKFAKSSWQFKFEGQLGVSCTGTDIPVMVPPQIQILLGGRRPICDDVSNAPAPTLPLTGSATSCGSDGTARQISGGSSLVPNVVSGPGNPVVFGTQSAARRPRQRSAAMPVCVLSHSVT